jgi:L-ascorbate metabolism protein UlaG (beta-lactamase superfamily)
MLTLTFLGHAAFLAEGDGKRVIFDPFLTGNPKAPYAAERLIKLKLQNPADAATLLDAAAYEKHIGK